MVEDPHYEQEGRGRTTKKKAAQAVEALAARLVESSDGFCNSLPIPVELHEELHQARRIKSRTARKRQLKRLAGLLRRDEESVAAIQVALDSVGRTNRAERDFFHHIEELRDAFCDPDRYAKAIEDAILELPDLDRQVFSRLAERVHKTGDKGASREIFKRLRALTETQAEK